MKGKNAAYPKAVDELKAEEDLLENLELRQNKYLNNLALAGPSLHQTTNTHQEWDFTRLTQHGRSIRGYEAMNMMRKGQIQGVAKGDIRAQVEFLSQIFGVAA